jgi:hypothetical protein
MATLLVTTGKAIVTNYLNGGAATQPKYVAWGTGAGTTGATDTTLFTEVTPRVSGTTSQVTTSTTNDTFQVVGTQTAGTSETITNAGLFDASTSGNLFVKGDFTGIPLNTSDSIQFTFKCQFS